MLRRLIRRFLVRQDGLHPQFRHWRFSGILIFNCCSHVLFAQAHHSMFCPLFFLPLGLLQRCTGLIIICLNAKLLVTARCVSASLPRAVRPTATRLARSARAFCSCGEYPNGFFWLLRGGLTTKTGALVDALDNLIAFAPVSGRQAALPAFPRSGVLAGVVASLVSRITRARPLFE
jgi:hypothetical protein